MNAVVVVKRDDRSLLCNYRAHLVTLDPPRDLQGLAVRIIGANPLELGGHGRFEFSLVTAEAKQPGIGSAFGNEPGGVRGRAACGKQGERGQS